MKKFNKILALAGTGLFLGATLVGAQTYKLDDYPAPFLKDGKFDMLPVYGDTSMGDDIAAAWDILAGITSGSQTSVNQIDGEQIDIGLNEPIGPLTLDDSDLKGFIDSKISFKGDDYDVHEELIISPDLKIGTSSEGDRDLAAEPALVTSSKGAISYKYVFDDVIDMEEISDSSPLDIEFLGEKIKITSIEQGSIRLKKGPATFFKVGDAAKINGHTIELVNVGLNSVVVKVNGVTGIIREGETREINGLEVKIDNIFYREEIKDSSAVITYGDDITSTIKHGDSIDIFGEEDNDDEDTWVWAVETDSIGLKSIGVVHNLRIDDADEDVKKVGESIFLPNNYAQISFVELQNSARDRYEISFDNVEDVLGNEFNALVFEGNEDSSFSVGNKKTEFVYVDIIDEDHNIYYRNEDNDIIKSASSNFLITNHDTKLLVEIDDGYLNFADIGISLSSLQHLGSRGDDAEDADITYLNRNIGRVDNDYLTSYGILIESVKNNADNDLVKLGIPQDKVEAKIIISSDSSKITTTNLVITEKAPPMVKASEVTNPASSNLLLVGGPVVNQLTARFIGSEWSYKPGESIIQIKENGGKIAMIVAGTDAIDTRRAGRVLRDYLIKRNQLTGTSLKITGTSNDISQVSIAPL